MKNYKNVEFKKKYSIELIEKFFKEFPEEKRGRKKFKEKEIQNIKHLIFDKIFQKGIKINPFKDLVNKYEYFFGEDQGRYIIEIEKTNIKKVNDLLEKNSVHFDELGTIDDNILSFNGEINLPIEELTKTHKYWLNNYMEN